MKYDIGKGEVIWERIFNHKGEIIYKVVSDIRRENYILYKNVGFMNENFIELGKAKDPPSLYKKFPEVQKLLNERRATDD